MSEQSVRATARCEDCGKAYRVPNEERTYACKACGGTVRSREGAPPHTSDVALIEGTTTCSTCQALNADSAATCAECGAALDSTQPHAGTREERAELRHEANAALKRAYVWIGVVTWAYRIGALAYATATFFAIVSLARTDVPERAGVLVVALTTLLSVLMLMGALHILFKPFAWTLVIATLATAVSVVHYVGPDPLGIAFAGSALWAALAWLALVPTYRFSKLIAEHKDLYIMHHASAPTWRSLRGRTPEQKHERLLAAMRRAGRRAWKVSATAAAAVALASAAGTYMVLANLRPQLLSDAVARFESAWNASDLAGAVDCLAEELRKPELARLQGFARGHGWSPALPPLGEGVTRRAAQPEDDPGGSPGGNQVRIEYDLGGVPLSTSWTLGGQTWVLTEISLPVPPFEPVWERFLEVWSSSDPQALVTFFSDESRPLMLSSIETAVAERGWTTFPAIVETQMSEYSGGSAEVTCRLERSKLSTEWSLRPDGTWGLQTLKFPRR